jgi:3-phenylpropionate/trans-cinnamate dioxygenase ferredoxin reductase subunit
MGLERLTGTDHVTGAVLADGTTLAVDFVIAGIGIVPNDGLARAAGIETDMGITVDAQGRSSDPNVWAAGDCARFPYRGEIIRLESVQNAIDQAECVAENMLGAGKDYGPKPWFWSDQYDVKLQIAGLNMGYSDVVLRPGATEGSQSVWYYREKTLLAVDAMNDPRNYMIGKRLIEAGRSPAADLIADPATDMKGLLTA